MSGIKIYGISGSRAIRSIWMAEELKAEIGFEYELVKTHFIDESKTPEYLAINPNGRVPALVDGDLVLFESLAINLYLAKKHPASQLAPTSLDEDALATQWSIWALTELESSILTLVTRHPDVAMSPPDPEIEGAARETLDRPLAVLEAKLAGSAFLLGDRFSVADLNVASVLWLASMIELDMSAYPHVEKWLSANLARPAYAAAQAM